MKPGETRSFNGITVTAVKNKIAKGQKYLMCTGCVFYSGAEGCTRPHEIDGCTTVSNSDGVDIIYVKVGG